MNNFNEAEMKILTHINYVEYINNISSNLEIHANINLKIASPSLKKLKNSIIQKHNFTHYIKSTLDEEYKNLQNNFKYYPFCSCWVSTKAYYLLFYQLCIIKTLVDSCNKITYKHSDISAWMKSQIKNHRLKFNNKLLNEVYDYQTIQVNKADSGLNLKKYHNLKKDEACKRKFQLLRKLSTEYSEYKKYKAKPKKVSKKIVFQNYTVSLFEFFYWNRIKSNYRDISFLHDNDDPDKHKEFYYHYYSATVNFFQAYDALIHDLYKKRFSEEL